MRRPTDVPYVVLSDRAEDVDEALVLIHDGFVEAGYMSRRPSGRRLHTSYLNPGSFFAIARMAGELAGTMAMVSDGPFGLPAERAFAEEIDALRTAGVAPIFEAGSRVVPVEFRPRAGRISMFMVASIFHAGLVDFPDATILITVAPEAERFLIATLGCERLSGPRPLFGTPAVLLVTSGPVLAAHLPRALTSAQRMVASLCLDPDPSWLRDHRSGRPLDADWLVPLLFEQGFASRLTEQLRLVGNGDPAMIESVMEGVRTGVAA